jgi:hypothetical protein
MQSDKINTIAIQTFMNQVRGADMGNQREIRMDIATAKSLSHTLALVMTRLSGNYEGLIQTVQKSEPTVQVRMDGGNWSEKE